MRPLGKINLVGMVMIAAVIAAIYGVVLFAGIYTDDLAVKEAIAAGLALAKKGASDDGIRHEIQERLRDVGTHFTTDQFNNPIEVPGLGLTDDQIRVERNQVTNTVLIEIAYERRVELKPLKRVVRVKFDPRKEGPDKP